MTAEPLGYDAYGDDDPALAAAFSLISDVNDLNAAEHARLDREDAIDRDTYAREATANAEVADMAHWMAVRNVVEAAELERAGVPATWDWRAAAVELGIDEYGNSLDDEGKAPAPAASSAGLPPVGAGAAS